MAEYTCDFAYPPTYHTFILQYDRLTGDCIIFLCQIEEDLGRTTIDRMNEYGSSDDIKESFDLLQQRVGTPFRFSHSHGFSSFSHFIVCLWPVH